jgi:hypothetical protein
MIASRVSQRRNLRAIDQRVSPSLTVYGSKKASTESELAYVVVKYASTRAGVGAPGRWAQPLRSAANKIAAVVLVMIISNNSQLGT